MYDIIIAGAGPAGASAALFAAKAGKKTLVIDSDQSMTKKAWIENHYGRDKISGPDLVETGLAQMKKFGAEHRQAKVLSIDSTDTGASVTTEEETIEAKHVLLATGALTDTAEKSGIQIKEGPEPRIKQVVDITPEGRTSLDHVWAAGTCAGKSVHTIVTSGHGAEVAINIISELNGERYVDHDVLK
ncbi:FAD-dependent oxidoreductase [Alkalicoccus urumqiensis]|uniref:Pyridine nucleotide-disulfide oxidoreductase n=1 Tax=Alkalicoccus urumqiensis TaxID=1548213 RepID=A0A2P6MIT9_ALKUR|nr:FAD-dependent oxidoreductase [Alkalicoccus urumqiensis]PRO66197.1 pyridine nucleotide-disulfide oxidoreductase [Alkalicoccus urumqiensis]